MRFLILPLMIVGLALAGCASIPEQQDAQNRISVVNKSFGEDFDFLYIPSSGAIADATFVAMSKSSGPSKLAHQMSRLLFKGLNGKYKLAVSGPSSSKTLQVIKDAFSLTKNKNLKGLDFMFIGNESDRDVVEKIVTASGANFVFTEY